MKNEKPEEPQKQIQELQKQLEEQTKLAEERLNDLKYLHADFDNYRKNFEKEKLNIIKLANESLIKDLLVILDDFEKALASIKDNEGLNLIYKKLFKTLESYGLKKIECLEKKFDPHLHEVISKQESDKADNIVIEEIKKGYTLNSKTIRPAVVKISEMITKEENKNG